MLVLRRLVTSSAVPVVLAALAAVAACSNSSSGDDSTGSGTTVGTGTFCDAETAWQTKCGTPAQACDEFLITDCTALSADLNADVLDAARNCLQTASTCEATPTSCLAGAAVTASGNANTTVATTAQLQIRTDYCTKCQPSGSDDCETVFFDADGPVGEASTQIVPYSDAIAAQIDACTQVAGCASSFQACADNAVTAALGNTLSDSAGQCVLGAFATTAPSTGDDDDDSDAGAATDASSGMQDASSSSDASASDAAAGDGGSETGGTCKDTYEPDDTSDTAAMLPELDDDGGTKTIMASISVAGQDDDWYFYVGNDAFNFTTAADPYAMVTTLSPMEVCVWAKETGGYAIPVTSAPCKAGTLTPFPTAGLGYDIGCCTTSSTAQIYDYGRTGDDDSSDILMRVSQMTSTLTCTDYTLTYAFKN